MAALKANVSDRETKAVGLRFGSTLRSLLLGHDRFGFLDAVAVAAPHVVELLMTS